MMMTAQTAEQRAIHGLNDKYGRRNWAPDETEYVQTRQVMRLTRRAFVLTAMAMLVLVTIVVIFAYMSQIRYSINAVNRENAEIRANIDMMRLELEQGKNIALLEERAASELGMRYPDASEVVFLR